MSSLSLRSFAHPDPSLLVFDFGQAEPFVLLKRFVQLDLLLLVAGVACIGFSPLASDPSQFGLSSSLHSFARLDFSPLTSGFAAVGSLLLSQSHVHLELSLLIAGISCTASVFFLSLIEAAVLGSVMPLRSFAQLGLTSFIPDCTKFGFTVLLLGHNTINTEPPSSTKDIHPKIVSLMFSQTGFFQQKMLDNSAVSSVISEAAELWTSELFAAGAGNTSNGFPALTYRPWPQWPQWPQLPQWPDELYQTLT